LCEVQGHGARPANRLEELVLLQSNQPRRLWQQDKNTSKGTYKAEEAHFLSSASTTFDQPVASIQPSEAHFHQFLLIEPYFIGI
jgi:hypothetical protein